MATSRCGIRPIVVGEALVRLTGRVLAVSNAHRFRQTMLPLQFGVGVPGGAEQIIHATRFATKAHPQWMSFQADFQNAFNCISHYLILNQLHRTGYDDLVPYFLVNYGSPTYLCVRAADVTTHWILSQEGVRQGVPLGPFFFALALQLVLEALSAELKKKWQDQKHRCRLTIQRASRHPPLMLACTIKPSASRRVCSPG